MTGFLACADRIYVQNVMWLPTVRYVKVTSSVGPILIMMHTTGTTIEDIFSITHLFLLDGRIIWWWLQEFLFDFFFLVSMSWNGYRCSFLSYQQYFIIEIRLNKEMINRI